MSEHVLDDPDRPDAKAASVHSLPALLVGDASENWSADAIYYEYSRAANPVGTKRLAHLPIATFDPERYRGVTTGVVAFDLSEQLGIETAPATSPALCASFLRIAAGESLATEPEATSELYYVLNGSGRSTIERGDVPLGEARQRSLAWSRGDFFVLPSGCASRHEASSQATLYWVTDEPLLRYLGVVASVPRFAPTLFPWARCDAELRSVAGSAHAAQRNRIAVLIGTAANDRTRTVTHVLWAMYGLVPAGSIQRPHRHQSVALDLVVDCEPGCHTLVGTTLDETGSIIDPQRIDWQPGGAFVTPPGWWHAHVNDSGGDARIVPIQDAGLHSYLRSLDIRFAL